MKVLAAFHQIYLLRWLVTLKFPWKGRKRGVKDGICSAMVAQSSTWRLWNWRFT